MILKEIIDQLHTDSHNLHYPEGIVKVDKPLRGTAFFPGGDGLYLENEVADHLIKYMILGQDYDNVKNYEKVRDSEKQSEVALKNRTWINILVLLEKAGISPKECFFTNALMGLKLIIPDELYH